MELTGSNTGIAITRSTSSPPVSRGGKTHLNLSRGRIFSGTGLIMTREFGFTPWVTSLLDKH